MNSASSKAIFGLTALTGASFVGWVAGVQYSLRTRNLHPAKRDDRLVVSENVRSMPGLPLFGTVSAASPILPSNGDVPEMGSKFSTVTASRISQIMKYGFPGHDTIRSYEDFVLSYDRRNRVAHWVFEHFNKEMLRSNENAVDRSKCEFKPDESIHPYFRSQNTDYKGSGYDRGHLAAAGNHKRHQTHVQQTFLLSNMAPQVGPGFNRNSWNRLEKYVRRLADAYKEVYVCTGPLYLPKIESDGKKYVRYEVIGSNHVAVPTHFYKIVVCETHRSELEMEAFVMPNVPIDDATPLQNFRVPPDTVERAAGLLFFDNISRDKLTRINGKKLK
ncbi:endonuclease G, mitochondrial-like [Prorops nasuta]|uniref:endonuclease G, mitochondrial-like n=1 Tax=Prorops nasuta TaxID=863751 RepID=UPI0034CDC68D